MVATTSPNFHIAFCPEEAIAKTLAWCSCCKITRHILVGADVLWQLRASQSFAQLLNVHFTELELALSHPNLSLGSQGYASAAGLI